MKFYFYTLYKDTKTFRQKVASKFTLEIQESKIKSINSKQANKPTSFVKLPLSIPVKTPKEIKKISRFFKKSN